MRLRGSVSRHVTPDGVLRFRLRVTIGGERKSLGLYDTEEEAAGVLAAGLKQIGARPRMVEVSQSQTAELRRMHPLEWPARGGVYLVLAGGLVKIGYALSSVDQRLRDLQAGSPSRLRLLAVLPGGDAEERELHRRFDADRVRGEWFRASPALVSLVRESRVLRQQADTPESCSPEQADENLMEPMT